MNLTVGVSMGLKAFGDVLNTHPGSLLRFQLPDGTFVPQQFHVTEVGRVRKDFIDCGGTVRSTERCVLQLWIGDDADHRLEAGKLRKIIDMAAPLLAGRDLPMEVEYDVGVITQFSVSHAQSTEAGILFQLGGRHTACLAPEKCCPTPAAGTLTKCC